MTSRDRRLAAQDLRTRIAARADRGSGGEALEIIRREPVSVLITDLVMPGMSGIDLLRASRSLSPETETVLMTAYGTVENAVEAMKQGAYDFVTKRSSAPRSCAS